MATPLKLTANDFKRKSFKTAPGGTYFVKITKDKTEIQKKPKGKALNVHGVIIKGSSKKISFFDNISAHVGWKIAQLLLALGIKKPKKGMTLEDVLKLAVGKELRAQLRETTYQGKKKNEVVTWLPLKKSKDEDDDEDVEDQDDEDSDEDEDEDEDDADESDDDDSDEDSDDDDDDDSDSDDDDDDSDDDDSDDDDDDDDEEEEEVEVKPRRKKGAKKSSAKKSKSKKSKSDDDEDDDE